MSKQTVVEWLKKQLEEYGSSSHLNLDWSTFDELIEQAKEMEREQIEDAYDQMRCVGNCENGKDYYNSTYKGGEQ